MQTLGVCVGGSIPPLLTTIKGLNMFYEDLSSEKNEEQQEKLLDDLKKLDALSDKVLANSKIIAEALSKKQQRSIEW